MCVSEEYTSCEFTIVSLDGKRWRWEVVAGGGAGAAGAERDAWVAAVEAQILASLQGRVRILFFAIGGKRANCRTQFRSYS